MRITELLEGRNFPDLNGFVKVVDDDGNKELDYDLPDDLMYFMHNNDEAYRKHMFPAIVKCIKIIKRNKKPAASIFDKVVSECYNMYLKEFPIRELSENLDEENHKKICEKIRDEVYQHIKDGKYE